jgi:tRNA wybutosine-synthesizing protein 3
LSNNCNGSGGQSVDYEASVGPEVKIPLDKCAKTNDEYLITKRRNGGRSCDDDDTGSIEAQYFGNQDSAWSEGVKHGFGNAKRHVLLSLFSHLVPTFHFS